MRLNGVRRQSVSSCINITVTRVFLVSSGCSLLLVIMIHLSVIMVNQLWRLKRLRLSTIFDRTTTSNPCLWFCLYFHYHILPPKLYCQLRRCTAFSCGSGVFFPVYAGILLVLRIIAISRLVPFKQVHLVMLNFNLLGLIGLTDMNNWCTVGCSRIGRRIRFDVSMPS